MPTPTEQLLSRTSYVGDGVTTAWNFTFASGYIDQTHVKAYTQSPLGVRSDLALVPGDFIGPYQLSVVPAVPVGYTLVIYRDTPKDAALVDFADGSNLTEAALDTLAKQAVFLAAETQDEVSLVVGPTFLAAVAQVAADAVSAAGAAASAAVSASTASANALIVTAGITEATLIAAHVDDVQSVVQTIGSALSGGFGFTSSAYDFGFVTDTATYLNLDCGLLP